MTNRQKLPLNRTLQKTPTAKPAKGGHVNIIKHFERNVRYNGQQSNCDLPEIDSDFDIKQCLQRISKNPSHEVYSQNHFITKARIITSCQSNDKKIVNKCVVPLKVTLPRAQPPTFKSKSCVENSSTSREVKSQKPKPTLPLKSKSFTTYNKIKRKINKENFRENFGKVKDRKISYLSTSSTEVETPQENPYIKSLKKEILSNKNKSIESWQDKKCTLQHNSEVHRHKVESLRQEISCLLNIKLGENKQHVSELKTEIAHFRRNEDYYVYNVQNQLDLPSNLENNKSSTKGTESPEDVQTCVKEFVDEVFDKATLQPKNFILNPLKNNNNCECSKLMSHEYRTNEQGMIPSYAKPSISDDNRDDEMGFHQQACKNKPKEICCPSTSSQDEYINSKIFEANLLIDRVKGTLFDIKNKANLKVSEDILIANDNNNEINTEEEVPQLEYEDIHDVPNIEVDRPKTRRPESNRHTDDSREISNKFKNTPDPPNNTPNNSILEEINSLECLQAKLNTINEQTESDVSSDVSEKKIVEKHYEGSVDSSSSDTVILQQSEAVQAQPETMSLATQYSHSSLDIATQTNVEHKILTAENTTSNEIPPRKLERSKHLVVQILPIICISNKLALQQGHNYFIDSCGKTQFHSHIEAENIGYYEIYENEVNKTPKRTSVIFLQEEEEEVPIQNDDDDSDHFNEESKDTNRIRLKSTSSSCSTVEHMNAFKETVINISEPTEVKEPSNKEVKESDSSELSCHLQKKSSRELVYKSFQLYDNPDHHDPGQFSTPYIDNSIYQTYINPKGLPAPSIISQNINSLKVNADTLQKISAYKMINPKKQPADTTPTSKRSPDQSLAQKEPNSKLWDIGLYSSKEVQCDLKSPVITFYEEKEQVLRDSLSYEKMSFTVSYSTEETITSDMSDQSKQNKKNDFPTEINEMILQTVEPRIDTTGQVSDYSCSKILKHSKTCESESTFRYLKEKLAKEHSDINISAKCVHLNDMCDSDVSSLSTDAAIPEFISGLTKSSAEHISKIIPKIRKSVAKDKDKHKNGHKTNFNVLPVEVHGDYISNKHDLKSPHLQLSQNGRYKDEENLFCDNYYPRFENLTLRRKVLKNVPKHNYVKKYTLDSSKSNNVTMEETLSEGEVKCQCSASMGEIHKCKSTHAFLKKQPKSTYKMLNVDSNVAIRERRTYFDNWITYYINKNIPLINDSSSSSNSK